MALRARQLIGPTVNIMPDRQACPLSSAVSAYLINSGQGLSAPPWLNEASLKGRSLRAYLCTPFGNSPRQELAGRPAQFARLDYWYEIANSWTCREEGSLPWSRNGAICPASWDVDVAIVALKSGRLRTSVAAVDDRGHLGTRQTRTP
jgi:hypothetical protein